MFNWNKLIFWNLCKSAVEDNVEMELWLYIFIWNWCPTVVIIWLASVIAEYFPDWLICTFELESKAWTPLVRSASGLLCVF